MVSQVEAMCIGPPLSLRLALHFHGSGTLCVPVSISPPRKLDQNSRLRICSSSPGHLPAPACRVAGAALIEESLKFFSSLCCERAAISSKSWQSRNGGQSNSPRQKKCHLQVGLPRLGERQGQTGKASCGPVGPARILWLRFSEAFLRRGPLWRLRQQGEA